MGFEKYRNSNSGVKAYKIEKEALKVLFNDMVYVYTYKKPGRVHVENMKRLALNGKGLATYISQNVKQEYDKKYKV